MQLSDLEYKDPIVGPVYANALDFFDSPTYNIRMILFRRDVMNALSDGDLENPDFNLNNFITKNNAVILAQTGVTNLQIDDLTLEAASAPERLIQRTVEFTLIEPNSVSFLDQLLLAKQYLGYESSSDLSVVLEIRFQGYSYDEDDESYAENEEDSGKPVVIAGPYYYKVYLTDIQANVDSTGAKYNVKGIILEDMARANFLFKFKQTHQTHGKNIETYLRDLEIKLNSAADNVDAIFSDVYTIDTSELLDDTSAPIENSNGQQETPLKLKFPGFIETPLDSEVEQSVRPNTENQVESYTIPEYRNEKDQQPIFTNRAQESIPSEFVLYANEGDSIIKYIRNLLSMSPIFRALTERDNKDLNEKTDNVEQAMKKGFATYFDVKTDLRLGEFDPKRKIYRRLITFTPFLYQTSRNDTSDKETETVITRDFAVARTLNYRQSNSLSKAYHYLFTGMNDQILNLDLELTSGIALLTTSLGGSIGEHATVSAVKANPNINTTQEQVTADIAKRENLLNNFIAITSPGATPSPGRLVFIDQLAKAVEIDPVTLRNEIDNNPEAAESRVRNLTTDQVIQANSIVTTFTENPENFAPPIAPTDATFISDLLDEDDIAFSLDTLDDSFVPIAAGDIDPLTMSKDTSFEKPNVQSANNVIKNTQGFFTAKSANIERSIFLLQVELTLRGDPWYLARTSLLLPDHVRLTDRRRDAQFYLHIKQPELFDSDVDDEDNNSGYRQFNKGSRTFSGVYRMLNVVNSFSGGVYTVTVNAHKLYNLIEPIIEDEPLESDPPP